jgi:transcriptional regulator with XRE-family HTH domain
MSENINEIFGCALEYYLRTSWKGGQKTLSAETGISIPTISQIKSGKIQASVKKYQKIANVFGFNLEDFLKKGREIQQHGVPIKDKIEPKKNIYEFPVVDKPNLIDKRLESMHENLEQIYRYGDDNLKSAIEMNLVSFRKTVDMDRRLALIEDKMNEKDKENISLKEENENLIQMIRKIGSG